MKFKFLLLLILLCLVTVASSCGNNSVQHQNKMTTTADTLISLKEEHSNTDTSVLIQTEEQTPNQELTEQAGVGGGVLELNKYRVRYYTLPAPFVDLVGEEECYQWRLNQPYPNDTNVMMMVNFVQDFNISREDFDKANLEFARRIKELLDGVPVMNPQDYANQEDDEIYNADIIYTFDNELINEYYLSHDYPYLYVDEYEEAVANGTYQTQTTDWVDIEQMEAEINAKYGAPEVTETVTTIPEETQVTE